jgi:NAD(P)H-hydrate epimerase
MERFAPLETLPLAHGVPTISAAQMAEVDRIATDEYGLAVEMLMENASRQTASAARACFGGTVAGKRIVVLAGACNNGGDALGAARHLLNWGALVTCVLAAPPERLREPARRQLDVLASIDAAVSARSSADEATAAQADEELGGADLILDGLLGYSVRGPPRDRLAALMQMANRSSVPILAVDLPSGLHPDTGEPLGIAIRAAATVTLALPKVGLLLERARPLTGALLLADIGIPPGVYARFGIDASAVYHAGDLVRLSLGGPSGDRHGEG